MALVQCPECGASISDTAVNCPHCEALTAYGWQINQQERNRMRKAGVVELIFGIILAIAGICMSFKYHIWEYF